VLHVSDVSIEEGYTYRWLHGDEDVIDAACELANALFRGVGDGPALLLENQWWPGFTFTEPGKTERLLRGIDYKNKGILLDTGHLMNTNTALKTQAEGADYILRMIEAHGSLAEHIRGMHLHYSLSGDYVREHTGFMPDTLPGDYNGRFAASYAQHILKIDRHLPWSDVSVRRVVERAKPDWLTHELSVSGREALAQAVGAQRRALCG